MGQQERKRMYFKFFKYEDLIKLKLPFRKEGKFWSIKKVDVNEEMKQLFVHIDVFNPANNNLLKKLSFVISRNQQLKIDNLGLKAEIVKYNLLQEAFRKKVHSIGNDLEILLRRKYPTVLKIDEDSVSEIGVNKNNYPLMYNSILMVSNEAGFEFYITNNKVVNIKHIQMINKLNFMEIFIDLEGKYYV